PIDTLGEGVEMLAPLRTDIVKLLYKAHLPEVTPRHRRSPNQFTQLKQGDLSCATASPGVQWVETAADLDHLEFYENMAEIEVPVAALDKLPFKNEDRGDSVRLDTVLRSIRRDGYNNAEPIIVRLGRRGRWVIVDAGTGLPQQGAYRGKFSQIS